MYTLRKIRGSHSMGYYVDEIIEKKKYPGKHRFYSREDAEAYAAWMNRLEGAVRKADTSRESKRRTHFTYK